MVSRLVKAKAKARARARARARSKIGSVPRSRKKQPTRKQPTSSPRPSKRPRPTRVTVASPSGREGRTITVSSRSRLARSELAKQRGKFGTAGFQKGARQPPSQRSQFVRESRGIPSDPTFLPFNEPRIIRTTKRKGRAKTLTKARGRIVKQSRERPPQTRRLGDPPRPAFESFIPFQQAFASSPRRPPPRLEAPPRIKPKLTKQTRGQKRSRGTPEGRKTTRRLITAVQENLFKPVEFPLEPIVAVGRAVGRKISKTRFTSDDPLFSQFGSGLFQESPPPEQRPRRRNGEIGSDFDVLNLF
jgi:hypothetical protein